MVIRWVHVKYIHFLFVPGHRNYCHCHGNPERLQLAGPVVDFLRKLALPAPTLQNTVGYLMNNNREAGRCDSIVKDTLYGASLPEGMNTITLRCFADYHLDCLAMVFMLVTLRGLSVSNVFGTQNNPT